MQPISKPVQRSKRYRKGRHKTSLIGEKKRMIQAFKDKAREVTNDSIINWLWQVLILLDHVSIFSSPILTKTSCKFLKIQCFCPAQEVKENFQYDCLEAAQVKVHFKCERY